MRKLQNLCGIVVALTLVLALAVAPSGGVSAQDQVPPQRLNKVPQEVVDFFGDGLTIEEFLSNTNGHVPFALKEYAEQEVTVIVEMTQPALAAKLVAENKLPSQMSPLSQVAYTNSLALAQKPVKDVVLGANGLVLGEYTKVYNGVMVRIAAKELSAIRAIAGVKAIHKAPTYEINLDVSVPLIGADDVWTSPDGYTGEGITIAVIDTGIDYTHASFGGAGTAAAYTTNDPDVVEAGTFPTAKVIGGYDFAGTAYDAGGTGAALVPVPDPDPLDEGGHGTHVSSTSAGFEVLDGTTVKVGAGVAPDALLYALKVFGADGSTDLVVNALEWAMDPDGDGDISDHVDVVNMSLGSSFGPGDTDDPDVVASNNAVGVGIIVVTSSGNSGSVEYITGAPGTASGNLSVAASTTGSAMLPFIKHEETEVPYLPSNPFTSATPVTLVDVDMVDDVETGLLCNAAGGVNPVLTPADALSGKLALIQRGTCSFEEKLVNAQELGAVGAIIYNAATSANDYISMLVGAATIPAGHTLYSHGLTLKGLHNLVVTVGPDTNVKRFASVTPADYVASFSSRGPRGTDSILKPEITAPGVGIFAAQMGSGSEGVSFNGTSMASPHVAGVAALVRQAHPDWTVEQVKAAIMNTAVDMNPADVNGYRVVPRTGAGRVNAYDAVFTDYVAVGDEDLVSLSWGVIEIEPSAAEFIAPDVKTVRVYNDTAAPISFTITSMITGSAGSMSLEMPTTVNVGPHSWQAFPVILHILPSSIDYDFFEGALPEFYGFVTLTESTVGAVELRVPFYFVARPVSKLTVNGTPNLSVDTNGLGYAQVNVDQTGPTPANLWAYTAMHVDGNELAQLDEGDQRLIGIDYVGFDGDDDLIGVAVNTWGSVHDPQPYFAEHDVYIDADQDGDAETVNFNFNYGWYTGAGDSNAWIVVKVNLANGAISLGSPYGLVTDFNTGVVEYILPAFRNNLDNVGDAGADTDYTVQVVSFDYNGDVDASPIMYYDNARPPFAFELADGAPHNSSDSLNVWINDLAGYNASQPEGVMLLDYQGKPGVGQAYFWPLTAVDFVPVAYLPVIFK